MLPRPAFFLVFLLCLAFSAAAPIPQASAANKNGAGNLTDTDRMPRADPAYIQYLERQSMLQQSSEMAKIVSGSELAWRTSASSDELDAMLSYADNWLYIHPMTVLTSGRLPVFSQLTSSSTWPVLRELGVRGLYVAPLQGGGALWSKEPGRVDVGDDVVQYDFSRAAGTQEQYQRLMSGIIDNNALIGSDLIPGATGIGPDFFLAVRNVREYPGIYCMVEVPRDLWKLLPDITAEWGVAALGQPQIEALSAEGLIPKALRDDVLSLGRMGGWAATAAVRGVDGNLYRWVYRFYGTPDYPVLNWEDPSRTAHRILSGSAVRQVGLQGQALLGLRFEALQGLDAAPDTLADISADGSDAAGRGMRSAYSVEPARTAAQSMSREVRRYGGWSWARDDSLHLPGIASFMNSGVNFVQDGVFSPGAEHALLTGDASLLRFMADEALRLKIVSRRLVHVMPSQDGINYSLPHLGYLAAGSGGDKAAAFRKGVQGVMRAAAARASSPLVRDNYLYATAPGLASLALGQTTLEGAMARGKDIEKGHGLLVFFKAMQPGVLMLSGQDLTGVLPLQWGRDKVDAPSSSRGAYGLTSSSDGLAVSLQGMPRAPQLYSPPDLQAHTAGSFLQRIGALLNTRSRYGIAKGSLIARPATKGKGSVALLTRLPGGKSFLLSVCNFSRDKVTEQISLAGGAAEALSRVSPIAFGGSHAVSGSTVSVSLGPWEGRALLLGAVTAQEAPATDMATDMAGREENVTPIPSAPPIPPIEPKKEPEKTSTVPKIILDEPGDDLVIETPSLQPDTLVPPVMNEVDREPPPGQKKKDPGRKRGVRPSAVNRDGW